MIRRATCEIGTPKHLPISTQFNYSLVSLIIYLKAPYFTKITIPFFGVFFLNLCVLYFFCLLGLLRFSEGVFRKHTLQSFRTEKACWMRHEMSSRRLTSPSWKRSVLFYYIIFYRVPFFMSSSERVVLSESFN